MSVLASAHAALARRLLFPLQERVKGHPTLRLLAQMEREQWLPAADLAEKQARRLARLVQRAAVDVPYYGEAFRRLGVQPRDIRGVADLAALPLLSKDDIRANLDALRSRSAGRLTRSVTGGSTGAPLIFFLGPTRIGSDVAARCRAEGWWGVGIGDLELALWAAPLDADRQNALRGLRDRLLRTHLVSAFEMSPERMDRCIATLRRGRYRRLFGYPGSIALLCERAAQTGRDLRGVGIEAVFVTGEYLWDDWRARISATFACSVANGYGGRDSGFVAHECPAGGMHVTADRLVVEIVDDAGAVLPVGQSGEIVVTHLDAPEMPLLRYRTGDVGALAAAACRCGRSLPLLARVDGRRSDFLVAADGSLVHGLAAIYVLREIEGVAQFRITQTARAALAVEIVTATGYRSESEGRIRDGLARCLGGAIAVEFAYRKTIPASASGKYRHVVSEVLAAPPAGDRGREPA